MTSDTLTTTIFYVATNDNIVFDIDMKALNLTISRVIVTQNLGRFVSII